MRKTKTDNRSTRRTRASIEGALLALMAQKNLSRITVEEIIDRANVCRTTFYAHYEDIYDLLNTVEDAILTEIREALDRLDTAPVRVEGLYPTIQAVVEIYARHADVIRLLNGEFGDPEFDERLQDTIYEATRRLRQIKEGAAFNEERHRLYSSYVISGGISVLNRLLSERLPWEPAATGRILCAMAAAGENVFLSETAEHHAAGNRTIFE